MPRKKQNTEVKQLSLFDDLEVPSPEMPKDEPIEEIKDYNIGILLSALAAGVISDRRLLLLAKLKNEKPEAVAIAKSFGNPKFTREFNLAKGNKSGELSLKVYQNNRQEIFYDEQLIGRNKLLYKSPLPGELQARMATASAIDRFLEYLRKLHQIIVLDESDRHVFLFIPNYPNLPDFNQLWESFLTDVAFSAEGDTKHKLPGLVQTFIAMLNSVTLSGRGFSTVDVPILTLEQSQVLAAWYLAVVREVEKRQTVRQRQINELKEVLKGDKLEDKTRKSKEKELEDKEKKQHDEANKYVNKLKDKFGKKLDEQADNWDKIYTDYGDPLNPDFQKEKLTKSQQRKLQKELDKLKDKIILRDYSAFEKLELLEQANGNAFELVKLDRAKNPEKFNKIAKLADNFTKDATDQINSTTGPIFAKCVIEMYRLLDYWELEKYREKKSLLPPLLTEEPMMLEGRNAGDDSKEFCYSCGVKLNPKTAKWQVLRFMFERPSQRRQSSSGEGRPHICASCSALAFASPLKMTDESIILELEPKNNGVKTSREVVREKVQNTLRMLTNKQLHLNAGKYLVLASDKTNKRDAASQKLGQVQFALAKVASIFPQEVLADFDFSLITQGSKPIPIASRHLIFIKGLMEGYGQSIIVDGKEINMTLGDGVRYVEKDLPVMAEYTLAKVAKFSGSRQRLELEKTRQKYHEIMNQEKPSKAKQYRDIAALTGLTYALASSVESTAKKLMKPEDAEREVSKLIEKVDNAVNFCYYATLGDTSKRNVQGRLYYNSENYFIYDKAKELLEKLVSRKEETGDSGEKYITVYSDDILNAYAYFAENGYSQEKDWKDLTYQVKLSLYTRFPELVRKLKSTADK